MKEHKNPDLLAIIDELSKALQRVAVTDDMVLSEKLTARLLEAVAKLDI